MIISKNIIDASINAWLEEGNIHIKTEGNGFGIALIIAEIEKEIMKESNSSYEEWAEAKRMALEAYETAAKELEGEKS